MNTPLFNYWTIRAARWTCLALRGLAWLMIVSLLLVLPYLFLGGPEEFASIQADFAKTGLTINGRIAFGLILALLLALVVIFERFFATLQSVVNSLREGDPFVTENAVRIRRMAWLLLASQGVALLGLTWSVAVEPAAEKLGVDGDFSPETLLAAFGLFILARVFRHGAAMREDLEGTV